jgi:Mn-dependent DtxR family transcriptional regulator
MPTPSIEDHLEKIYVLIEKKGYARAVDIAAELDVSPSSVTRMVQKLDDLGFANYERYRNITLTAKGKRIAKAMAEKHHLLENFLVLIGVNPDQVYEEVEGLEHYISKQTASCISGLVNFINEHPEIKEAYFSYREGLELNG